MEDLETTLADIGELIDDFKLSYSKRRWWAHWRHEGTNRWVSEGTLEELLDAMMRELESYE